MRGTRALSTALLAILAIILSGPAAGATPQVTVSMTSPSASQSLDCTVCDVVGGLGAAVSGNVAGVVKAVTPAAVTAASTVETAKTVMNHLNPATAAEAWAKTMGQSAASLLADIQKLLLAGEGPALTSSWYLLMYGVCWGIGCVVAAFAFMVAVARASSGGPESAALLRESGVTFASFMPLMTILPFGLTVLWTLSQSLAKWFGDDSVATAQGVVSQWVTVVATMDGFGALNGGAGAALAFFLLTFLGALLAKFELTMAQYGGYLIPLLVPALFALAINPRWKKGVKVAAGALTGVLLVPVLLFFSFWVMWKLTDGLGYARSGGDAFNLFTVVLVGIFVATAAPLMMGVVAPMLMAGGGHDTVGGPVRVTGRSAATSAARLSRLASQRGRGRSARPLQALQRPPAPPESQPSLPAGQEQPTLPAMGGRVPPGGRHPTPEQADSGCVPTRSPRTRPPAWAGGQRVGAKKAANPAPPPRLTPPAWAGVQGVRANKGSNPSPLPRATQRASDSGGITGRPAAAAQPQARTSSASATGPAATREHPRSGSAADPLPRTRRDDRGGTS